MKTKTTFIVMTALITILQLSMSTHSAYAQQPDLDLDKVKHSSGIPLKLSYMGAVSETKGTTQYHQIILQVTNRGSLGLELFMLPGPTELPPNPCKRNRARLVSAVRDEAGRILSSCMPIGSRDDLAKLSFLIEKGTTIPKFVYVVLTDLKTSAAYKSNLVSPLDGSTK